METPHGHQSLEMGQAHVRPEMHRAHLKMLKEMIYLPNITFCQFCQWEFGKVCKY